MNRLEQFVAQMPPNLDAVLLTSSTNRFYYTGFFSSAGVVLATKSQCYFIIDSRYFEAAVETVKNCKVILQDELYVQLGDLLKKHTVKTLGIESDKLTVSEYNAYKEKFADIEIPMDTCVSEFIKKHRSIKSHEEVECIIKAQEISEKVFDEILNYIKVGRTEREIALQMEMTSRKYGSQEVAFSYIVASGTNSSRPHAVPCEKKIDSGDFIVLDYGATVGGYRSDMTRTICVGKVSDKQRQVYNIVLEAQLKALSAIKAGEICSSIDKIARDYIDATQYKGLFGHGLGHSLGLDIHEDPRFGKACDLPLQNGMVMTVEPGIYIAGEFGVRIEDMVLVTENSYKNLTTCTKELVVL